MKKLFSVAVTGLLSLAVLFSVYSFTFPVNVADSTNTVSLGNIEFKVTNNTGSEFKYCVNGGHNYINNGSTKSFSYPEGQSFYYVDGSNCGKLWFKVTSSMSGKTYKVTELK